MSLTVHDISVPNHPQMLHYGRRPEKTMVESIANGDPGNVSRWLIGSHTGTHVDAPAHFVEGATTIEDVSLDVLVGPAVVLDLTVGRPVTEIGPDDLVAAGLDSDERVLLKTPNSTGALRESEKSPWVGLSKEAAELLVERGVRLVGIDYLTIDSPAGEVDWPVHHVLCGAGVAILEVIDLSEIAPGPLLPRRAADQARRQRGRARPRRAAGRPRMRGRDRRAPHRGARRRARRGRQRARPSRSPMATTLVVVYPHQNALGGDLIALVRDPDGTVRAVLSAGAAPRGVDVDAIRAAQRPHARPRARTPSPCPASPPGGTRSPGSARRVPARRPPARRRARSPRTASRSRRTSPARSSTAPTRSTPTPGCARRLRRPAGGRPARPARRSPRRCARSPTRASARSTAARSARRSPAFLASLGSAMTIEDLAAHEVRDHRAARPRGARRDVARRAAADPGRDAPRDARRGRGGRLTLRARPRGERGARPPARRPAHGGEIDVEALRRRARTRGRGRHGLPAPDRATPSR